MKYIKSRKLIKENKKVEFDIPDIIWNLNKIFNDNGYKLYIVGGAIRDFETGDSPKDYDLSTDALPDDVLRILKPFYPVKLQGEAFGVVVVNPPGYEEMEIATFRKDITKGRNPDVQLGVTIEDDVQRRDLTFNAMFYDLQTKEIIDLVGGREDLKNRIVRMVGNPIERIEEDPLRILRIFRFASRYGSKLSEETKKAIHLHHDLSSISMERIWNDSNGEFMKSFKQAKDFQDYLDFITEFKLWDQILPGINVQPDMKSTDNIVLVLAQLTQGNAINKIKKSLTNAKIASDHINKVVFLHQVLNVNMNNAFSMFKSKERYKVDTDMIKNWFDIKNVQDHDIYKFINYKPVTTAKMVMDEYGIKPGPELGKKIQELEVNHYKEL